MYFGAANNVEGQHKEQTSVWTLLLNAPPDLHTI